jgi:AhpD family alkylhydroperoxidase
MAVRAWSFFKRSRKRCLQRLGRTLGLEKERPMKKPIQNLSVALLSLSLALLSACAPSREAQAQERATSPEAQAAYSDIEKTLGLVPSFMKAFPEEAIGAAWEEFKTVQLNPASAIPPKYKELIGLAVAAQIPCRYCSYFHTKAAGLDGAEERELKEAVVMAAITRQWSTVLNGVQTDENQFRAELGKVIDYVKKPHGQQPAVAVTDAPSAYRDMEATLGLVPWFFKQFPEPGIAGAWREFKTIQLNPHSALPGKYKELIGLAVAAQIPCRYCIVFHTETARLNGASDVEIREAVAMASLTRHWSTFLNGMLTDETVFRRETDQAIANVRRRMQMAAR